jgi:hypothetical protein
VIRRNIPGKPENSRKPQASKLVKIRRTTGRPYSAQYEGSYLVLLPFLAKHQNCFLEYSAYFQAAQLRIFKAFSRIADGTKVCKVLVKKIVMRLSGVE